MAEKVHRRDQYWETGTGKSWAVGRAVRLVAAGKRHRRKQSAQADASLAEAEKTGKETERGYQVKT